MLLGDTLEFKFEWKEMEKACRKLYHRTGNRDSNNFLYVFIVYSIGKLIAIFLFKAFAIFYE